MNDNINISVNQDSNLIGVNTVSRQGILQAALEYAQSGIPVFPCNPDNKRPMTPHGFKDATTDCEAIEDWGDWSDSLIGIPTGKASGLFVIDIDVKGNANGFDTLSAHEAQYGALPATLTVTTPSGGEHRYFRMPDTDPPLGNSPGNLGAGIDVRGEGGYVIAPPSVNVNGNAYQFVDGSIDPVPLPAWMIDLLTKPRNVIKQPVSKPILPGSGTGYGNAELGEMVLEMTDTLEGSRNNTLNRLAYRVGQLVAAGEIKSSDSLVLIEAAISAGLSKAEARMTFLSGFRAGEQSPATAPTVTNNTKHKAREVIVQCAADITMKPIDWLWQDWLPKGKLTILAGKPGAGKTTLALSIAATITVGGDFPDGVACEEGNILIWSGEDAPEDILTPRLAASGANLKRCHFIQGSIVNGVRQPFDPAIDIPNLEDEIRKIGDVSLLIIDPVVNAVKGDMNKANDVRRGLQPLVDFAENNHCTVLGITHFRKGGSGSEAQERVLGSQAFVGVSRMTLVAAQRENTGKRVLAKAKSNIASDSGGFEYTIHNTSIDTEVGPIDTTYAVWGSPIEGTAGEILGDVEGEAGTGLDDAVIFLRDILSEGEVPQKDIASEAEIAGFSSSTLNRAKKKLHIVSRKTCTKGPWLWSLPDQQDYEDYQNMKVINFNFDNLR